MIRAGTVSAVLWGIHPWEPQVFLISVQKLCLAGGTVWFCLCACYTSLVPQVQDLKASGPPALGRCWSQAASLTGMLGTHQARLVGSTWHRGCRELHVTERQEGGREPCGSEMPWDWKAGEEEEGGMLLVPCFGVTGNKHTVRVPRLHRDGLSSPELFSSARQISRKDICQ